MNSYSDQNLLTPPQLRNKYQYVSLLGEGANGKTWLAFDRIREQKVAIKELKLTQTDEFKSIELFQREAEILKSIKVHGVPKFYDSYISTTPETPSYIIQQFIDYPSIQSSIDNNGIFTEKDTLAIILEIAKILLSLQTYYTPPIIHRDIKPSNILFKKIDGSLKVFLIDFGAVANPQKRAGGSTIAGTFGYMPPEQIQGTPCIQSDFYALGATALHMMTGVSPCQMDSNVFKLNYEPILKKEAPHYTKNMEELLDILLQPEVQNRPNSAKTLIEYIENVQNDHSPKYETNHDVNPTGQENPIRRFLNFFLQRTKHALLFQNTDEFDPINCQKTQGTLRGYKQIHQVLAVEYTFEAQGRVWCGIDECPKAKQGIRHFPFPCTVLYNPNDPRINYIFSEERKHLYNHSIKTRKIEIRLY